MKIFFKLITFLCFFSLQTQQYIYVDMDSYESKSWSKIINDNNIDAAQEYIANTQAIPVAQLMNVFHQTPLIMAVLGEKSQLVKLLIDAGCDVNIDTFKGALPHTSLLVEAVMKGNLEIVKLLVQGGAHINFSAIDNRRYFNHHTPLTYAANNQKFEMVKFLMESGASIDKKNGHGDTALKCASSVEMLQLILSYKPNLFLTDANGDSVMWFLNYPYELNELDEKKKILLNVYQKEIKAEQLKIEADQAFLQQILQGDLPAFSW